MSNSGPHSKKQKQQKKLILNFLENAASGHQFPGGWKNPKDRSKTYKSLEYWTSLAKLAERGIISSIFIGDAMTI